MYLAGFHSLSIRPIVYYVVVCVCYHSKIGNEEQLDYFELHICVKDYCFARDDRLVGVAVMQLKDIDEQVRDSDVCVIMSVLIVCLCV